MDPPTHTHSNIPMRQRRGGAQTNPLQAGKQEASALFAHLNGSGPVTTPARETPGPIADSRRRCGRSYVNDKLLHVWQKVAVTNGL